MKGADPEYCRLAAELEQSAAELNHIYRMLPLPVEVTNDLISAVDRHVRLNCEIWSRFGRGEIPRSQVSA